MGPTAFLVLTALACVLLWGPVPGSSGRPTAWPGGGRGARPGGMGGSRDAQRERQQIPVGGVSSVPLLLELLGAALDSGLTVQGALRVVANVADPGVRESLLRVVAGLEIGASWQSSWAGSLVRGDIVRIHEALSFGALTGAPAAPILYAEAQQHRTAAGRLAEKRAAALGVKLVLPLGLCSLPAFIALGIVPVVVAMVPAF